MPIIEAAKKQSTTTVRFKLPTQVKYEAEKYCNWAQIDDFNYFITAAIKYVLSRDKDWCKIKNNITPETDNNLEKKFAKHDNR